MCVGIPMQVRALGVGTATCVGRSGEDTIDMMMVGDVPVGSWILAWNHKAIRVIDQERAAQVNQALDAVEAVMNGKAPKEDDVQGGFGDLLEGQASRLSPEFLNALAKK